MKRLIVTAILAVTAVSSLHAVPSLGVATDSGLYIYTGSSQPSDAYLDYFADDFMRSTDGNEGFVIGASGSNLTVFSVYRPDRTPLYLLSNTGGDNFPITFGGAALVNMGNIGKITGFNNPSGVYYGLRLPSILSAWETHLFGQKTYYLYTAELTYAGDLGINDYFMAAADISTPDGLNFGSGKKDDVSPRTTSANGGYPGTPVPEPPSVVLLTFGLAAGLFRSIKKTRR